MTPQTIYLLRHGQTYFNLENKLGGDSGLTTKGFEHAEKVSKCLDKIKLETIHCSMLRRSIQTAEVLHKYHPETPLIQTPELNEISSGDMDSMTYEEFEQKFSGMFEARQKDKYYWCFPNGESYESALERVKPLLDTLKSEGGNCALVGHQGMNRIILGSLLDLPKIEIPFLVTPNDVIFVIDPNSNGVSHIKDGEIFKGYVVDRDAKKADV